MSLEFAAIAQKHFGAPNKSLSSKTELRFGTHGSKSVNLKTGVWFDHESNDGGSLYQLPGERWPDETRPNGNGAAHSNGGNETSAKNTSKQFRIVKTWSYTDENGAELFEVCRLENGEIGADGKRDKTYRQRRKDALGKYIWDMVGVRKVPYRLPQLIEAIGQSKTIFVVEGEKSADAVIALGGVATCNAMGAGKWPDDLTAYFKNAAAVILPDNDEPGAKHAGLVATKLQGTAQRVRIIELPNLPPKGDIADWIVAGGTLENLEALVAGFDESDTTASDDPPVTKSKRKANGAKNEDDKEKRTPHADKLIAIATAGASLFHDADGNCYADLGISGRRETRRLKSREFSGWLRRRYFEDENAVPNSEAMSSAVGMLEAHAQFNSPLREVFIRVGAMDSRLLPGLATALSTSSAISNAGRIQRRPASSVSRSWNVMSNIFLFTHSGMSMTSSGQK